MNQIIKLLVNKFSEIEEIKERLLKNKEITKSILLNFLHKQGKGFKLYILTSNGILYEEIEGKKFFITHLETTLELEEQEEEVLEEIWIYLKSL